MYADLTNTPEKIVTGKDGVVIMNNFESLKGGRTLDVAGFAPETIGAGHPIIRETSTGKLKPMPINGGATAYAALPASHTYVGVLVATILKSRPFAGVMVRGTVNVVAAPYDMATIAAAVTTANPHIVFRQD